MNAIVCVKQVPDPETPTSEFRIDPATNKVVPAQGVPPVGNPFDEQAVEAALRLKDKLGGKVSVISLGPESARDAIKKALAMGADEGFLLNDAAFEDGDSGATARALAAAIKRIGEYDLILCGRQAADWDNGQVGSILAEMLELPCITVARDVQIDDGTCRVERVTADGFQVYEAPTPVVVTVSNELGEPRYPSMKGIMAAQRKPLETLTAADLGLDTSEVGLAGSQLKLLRLYIPSREGECEIIEGEDAADAARNLAKKLKEEKII